MREGTVLGPLIFEQVIVKIRENYFVCMTLTEPIIVTNIE